MTRIVDVVEGPRSLDILGISALFIPKVPKAEIGYIGGSGTWAMRFPEELGREDAVVEGYIDHFETSHGPTGPAKLIRIGGQPVLRFAMHNWYDARGQPRGIPPWTCADQIVDVFLEAGVKWALVEGSVGGIQRPDKHDALLPPWSVITTSDFIMHWPTPRERRGSEVFFRMREPFCAPLRQILREEASREPRFTVYGRGTYVCTPMGRFETSAEIQMLKSWGAHVVGQSLGHEAPPMVESSIHFAALNIVSNFAEGLGEWVAGGMDKFYRECAPLVGNVIVNTIKRVTTEGLSPCDCGRHLVPGLAAFPVPGA